MPSELYPKLEKILIDMIGKKRSNREIIAAIQALYHIETFPDGEQDLDNMLSAIRNMLERNED